MSGYFLQCDDCHHVVDLEHEITKADIGTPCPVCESDMLTERDFKAFRRIRWVFKVLEFFGLARKEPRDENDITIRVHHHNGRTTVDRIDANFYGREGDVHIGPR